MYNIEVFDKYFEEYDKWYEENRFVYLSELNAVKELIPEFKFGVEIGVGTGRFALPLGIEIGVEPSISMAKISKSRGLIVLQAMAEDLPFRSNSFDLVLMIVTICFVRDPTKSMREANRILKNDGTLVLGIIDKNSFLGKLYKKRHLNSVFYKEVKFFSVSDLINMLTNTGFYDFEYRQTVFKYPRDIKNVEHVEIGYGRGGFVVISAKKKAYVGQIKNVV